MKPTLFSRRLPQAMITLLLVSALFATTAFARRHGTQDFILHNATGVEINELFVSPHTTDEWEEDILGADTLADGESLKITFNDRESAAKWDLKVTDKEGNSIEWENLNLNEISEVTLHYKNGRAWADIE